MSLLDIFGPEPQGDLHPGKLTFPGTALGVPIIGKVPANLSQDEYAALDHRFYYKAQAFRTWVPEEMERYCQVQERATNLTDAGYTWFAIRQRQQVEDKEGRGWVIWLEWIQAYGVAPRTAGEADAVHTFVRKGVEGGAVAATPPADASGWAAAAVDPFDPFADPRS